MKKPGRALRQAEGTPAHRHPDADRPTRRIPFHEMRALVMSLIDNAEAAAIEAGEIDADDAAAEFDDTQPTTFRPRPRGSTPGLQLPNLTRAGTLDALIAELRIAYARQMASPARRQPRRRTDPVVREVNPPRPSSNRR